MAGVPEILVSGGVAAVLAAVAGGGLKAFGVELPLLATVKRQILVLLAGGGLIALGLVAGGDFRPAVAGKPEEAAAASSGPPPTANESVTAAGPAAPTPKPAEDPAMPPAATAVSSDRPDVPNIVSLPFAAARQLLLQNSWAPINLGNPMKNPNLGLRAEEVLEAGYGETVGCGGDLGYCLFRYRDPRGYILEVTAVGEDLKTATVNGANVLDCSERPKPEGC